MAKKTIINEVASALGAAAARVENAKPKRSVAAKHSKAKTVALPEETAENSAASAPEPVAISPIVEAADEQVSIDRGQIALQAYLYWEQRGCQGGSEEQDWLRAERELKSKATTKQAAAAQTA